MAHRELEQRVENIEDTLTVLNTLPARVGSLETQFLQFGAEVRAEFSATRTELRAEMREHADALRKESREQGEMLVRHFTDLHREVREGFARLKGNE